MTQATFAETNRLLSHCLEQLEQHEATTSPQLTAAQNALLAYLRFDHIAEEEGLAALIRQGWGEELLCGDLAAQLAAWQVPILPALLQEAEMLYRRHHQDVLRQTEQDQETLRAAFPQFAPVDENYFYQCETVFASVYGHVRRHYADFADLLTYQAA